MQNTIIKASPHSLTTDYLMCMKVATLGCNRSHVAVSGDSLGDGWCYRQVSSCYSKDHSNPDVSSHYTSSSKRWHQEMRPRPQFQQVLWAQCRWCCWIHRKKRDHSSLEMEGWSQVCWWQWYVVQCLKHIKLHSPKSSHLRVRHWMCTGVKHGHHWDIVW